MKFDNVGVGVSAFGLKMKAITKNTDLRGELVELMQSCEADGLIDDGDILCVTEAVVAKAQDNHVTIDEVAKEIRSKTGLNEASNVLVLYPITSRNRFSDILRSIARAFKEGTVLVQFSFPADEVGNRVVGGDLDHDSTYDCFKLKNNKDLNFYHPITDIDYVKLYKDIIEEEGSNPEIYLSNNRAALLTEDLDGVIVSSIHSREEDREFLEQVIERNGYDTTVHGLTDFCNAGENSSRWGLLGSNLCSDDRLKLLPKEPFLFVNSVKEEVKEKTGRDIEVMIYGDGAYKDPETGIYELADPETAFGYTDGLATSYREGNKFKFLVDKYLSEGYSREEIDRMIRCGEVEAEDEGTTPRKVKDLVASLADLVSGSSDAGTPAVLVKNFI